VSPRNHADARARAAARDRGLRRVRTATGWITAASAAGAVVLAGGYAQALPGKTSAAASTRDGAGTKPTAAASTSTASNSAATSSAATPAARASSAATLQAPAQAPTQAPTTAASTAHATSGGS